MSARICYEYTNHDDNQRQMDLRRRLLRHDYSRGLVVRSCCVYAVSLFIQRRINTLTYSGLCLLYKVEWFILSIYGLEYSDM